MACGTPVIATDQGVFTETVPNGIGGFRFRLLREAVQAVKDVDMLDPVMVRQWARNQYSLEAIAPQFQKWFEALGTLRGDGWYSA